MTENILCNNQIFIINSMSEVNKELTEDNHCDDVLFSKYCSHTTANKKFVMYNRITNTTKWIYSEQLHDGN